MGYKKAPPPDTDKRVDKERNNGAFTKAEFEEVWGKEAHRHWEASESAPHAAGKYVWNIVMAMSLVQGVFTSCVIADGRSVATLMSNPPEIWSCVNSSTVTCGNYTYRDLLRFPYGIGTSYDQMHQAHNNHGSSIHTDSRNLPDAITFYATSSNITANEVFDKVLGLFNQEHVPYNPANFMACKKWEKLARGVQAFTYIAAAVVFIQIIFAALTNAGTHNYKTASLALQLLIFLSYLILVVGTAAIFNKEWKCNNTYIREITLSHHFDIGYATAFFVVCMACPPLATIFISLWATDEAVTVTEEEEVFEEEMKEGKAAAEIEEAAGEVAQEAAAEGGD